MYVTIMKTSRLITLADAEILVDLYARNREFLAPWVPIRPDEYFTVAGQRADIGTALDRCARGTALPHVILNESGDVAGRITINDIVRGAFQSCSLGYWLSESDNGRGLASAAVGHIMRTAFEDLGLHRIEAGTLRNNARSRHVLERNGFVRFGIAPMYLKIAGEWQDHVLYQALSRVR